MNRPANRAVTAIANDARELRGDWLTRSPNAIVTSGSTSDSNAFARLTAAADDGLPTRYAVSSSGGSTGAGYTFRSAST
jgi:hypothetical protein